MFEPGDVVECIKAFSRRDLDTYSILIGGFPPAVPQVKSLYRVDDVADGRVFDWATPEQFIKLREIPDWGWAASHFRKVEKGEDIFSLVTKKDVPKELEPA